MSPTSRRRRGEPTLDEAAAVAGTRFADATESDAPGSPAEPEWLRDAPFAGQDPTTPPVPPPDPAVLERRRAERAEQIVRALNPEQARAVTTTEGPLLILAGAGSGKTRVLAHRIAYLVGVKNVPPWRILAVTFTNKAASELRDRIISLVGEGGREVQAGTFHALCARVLRQEGTAIGIDRRFVIYDTDDQQALMKQVLREEDLPLTGEFRPSAVLGAISRAKNEMLDPTFLSENAANHRERTIARLATRYQERLKIARALDFDDLLLEAVRLFDEAPDVLAKYQDRWRYLHVDEYQDTNRAQYLWVKALATKYGNLAVVGDDDQSIYSWRGADLRNILDFERDWPNTAVVKLERNYRSTQLILDAAHAVVSRNTARKDKKLWTENAGGMKIQRFEAYNEEEEAEWIARQVEGLIGGRGTALTRRADEDEQDTKFRAREIAVMYRMNAQSRAIEESFLRYGIRYQLIGGTRFYARREVKDALAYLRILRSDTDSVSFERIINVPARAIGDKTIEALRAGASAIDPETGEPSTTWSAIERGARGELPSLAPRTRTALAEFAGAGPPPPLPRDRAAAPRAARRGPGGLRLPRDAGRRFRGGRGTLGEPARAALGDDPLRRPRAGGRARPLARGDGARRRPGFLRGRRGRGDAHHAARGEGPRVPGRVHRGARGGAVPAQPRARGRAPARGGAAARVRRDHPREAPAVPVARVAAGDVGDGPGGRAVTVPARDPGGADDRPAARRPRRARTRSRSRPGLRFAPHDPVQYPGPWRRAGLPAGERPAGRPGRRGAVPALSRPGGAPGGVRRGRAVRDVREHRHPVAATRPPRPIIPGERQFRDGDRVRHGRWGDGIVVTSKLTRSDEEITVAFKDPAIGRKTMLASLANLDVVG